MHVSWLALEITTGHYLLWICAEEFVTPESSLESNEWEGAIWITRTFKLYAFTWAWGFICLVLFLRFSPLFLLTWSQRVQRGSISLLLYLKQLLVSFLTVQSHFLVGGIRSFKKASEPYPHRLFRAAKLFCWAEQPVVFSSAFKQYWNSDDELYLLPSAGKWDRCSPRISGKWGTAVGLGGQRRCLVRVWQELIENTTR